MAQIQIGAAIGAGFGLIGRRPLSVLLWGAVPVLLQVGAFAVLAPYFISLFAEIAQMAASGAAVGAAPQMPASIAPHMLMLQAMSQLFNLAQLLVGAVIYCAVYRAVLHPEKSAFGYLRLSVPEFMLAALIFGGAIVLVITLLLLVIPFAIIGGIAAAASHGSAASLALIPIIIGVFVLVAFFLVVYLAVRFAFVGPMMVDDGKFHLFESWSLTKGHVGSLMLIALAVVVILLVIEMVIGAVVFAVGAGALVAMAGGVAGLPTFFQQAPMVIVTKLAPFLAVWVVLAIPLGGAFQAIVVAPWAHAYRDLKPEAAAVFA